MKADLTSGLSLIASSLAYVLVMTFHPTAAGMHGDGGGHAAHLAAVVHALAIAATPVLFFGLLGVARRLGGSDLSTAALVMAGFGGVAVLSAATASGFIFPGVLSRVAPAAGADPTHALLLYTGLWNQAFAMIQVIAYCVSILLWSAAILRGGGRIALPLPTALAGAVIALGVLTALASDHVQLDVHGARLIILGQSAWFLWIGILLCRSAERVALP
jgi:hypothetical protein